MKIKNIFSRKILSDNLFRFVFCLSFSFSLVFSPLSSVFASPAVVPVSSELIGELLVALGLMSYDEATQMYDWRTDSELGRQFYTEDIFGNVVLKIKNGESVTSQELEPLLGTVIPDGVYTTDGTDFYVGSDKVTTSDLFLLAKSLVGVSYSMPTNVTGSNYVAGQVQGTSNPYWFTSPLSSGSVGSDTYYLPFFYTNSGAFIYPLAINFSSDSQFNIFRLKSGITDSGVLSHSLGSYLGFVVQSNIPQGNQPFVTSFKANPNTTEYFGMVGLYPQDRDCIVVSGTSSSFSFSDVVASSLLTLSGSPVMGVNADVDKIEDAVVQVELPATTGGNGNPPSVPPSPKDWLVWAGVGELLETIQTGMLLNNGTSFSDYVNNNYNYNTVNVDFPEKVENDVTLSGGLDVNTSNNLNVSGSLDVNGSGDVNITVHEDVSLPSAGDGSGFYNPNAADVVGALGKDNPVVSVISGVFSAIDPALLGVFSVSVSLLFVLGLWKLIRG